MFGAQTPRERQHLFVFCGKEPFSAYGLYSMDTKAYYRFRTQKARTSLDNTVKITVFAKQKLTDS